MASFFQCSFWWFVLGLLVGWLLNWLLWRLIRRDPPAARTYAVATAAAPSPAPTPSAASLPPAQPAPSPAVNAPAAPPAPAVTLPAAPAVPAIDLAAAAAAGFRLRDADDLTIVEGIGPKIRELLNAAGIRTFAQLAAAEVTTLTGILERGGSHFNLANPLTWPEQAALAASNRWAELRKLQDELDGGVRRDEPHRP